MFNLIKSDLTRIIKDKLFLILCILGVVFAIITPLLYVLIRDLFTIDQNLIQLITNSKSMFFSAFSLGSDFGLIAPILMSIIICKDFSQGTIRNKIICGKSRRSIFASYTISCGITLFAVVLLHALVMLGFSLIFFEYQPTPFVASDIGYFFASLGMQLVIYAFVSCMISFFCVVMKNVGLSIVTYFGINFFFILIGSVISVALSLSTPADSSYQILTILNDANLFTSTIIGSGNSYTFTQVLCILLPPIIGGVACVLLGTLIFKKKNLK